MVLIMHGARSILIVIIDTHGKLISRKCNSSRRLNWKIQVADF